MTLDWQLLFLESGGYVEQHWLSWSRRCQDWSCGHGSLEGFESIIYALQLDEVICLLQELVQ
jgi:hypothetical protein